TVPRLGCTEAEMRTAEPEILAAAAALVRYVNVFAFKNPKIVQVLKQWIAAEGRGPVAAALQKHFADAFVFAWLEVTFGPQRITKPDGGWYRDDPGTLAWGGEFDRWWRHRVYSHVEKRLHELRERFRKEPGRVFVDPARLEEPGRGDDAAGSEEQLDRIHVAVAYSAEQRAGLVVEGPDDRVPAVHLGPRLHAVLTVIER